MILNAADLHRRIDHCMQADRHRLRRRVKAVAGKSSDDASAAGLLQDIESSLFKIETRKSTLPTPQYPDELPVVQQRDAILEALAKHQVIIVCGETGSGKTTQLPKMCLEFGLGVAGYIGHTQPVITWCLANASRIESRCCTTGNSSGY